MDIAAVGFEDTQQNMDIAAVGFEDTQQNMDIAAVGFEDTQQNMDIAAVGFEDTQQNMDIAAVGFEDTQQNMDIAAVGFGDEQQNMDIATVGFEDTQQNMDIATVGFEDTQQNMDIAAVGFEDTAKHGHCGCRVVRVGVTVWRYVTLAKARPWLTHTLKNNRGRGQAYPKDVQDDEVSGGDQLNIETVAVKGDNINQHTSGSGSIAVPLVLAFPNITQEPNDGCSSHGDVCDPSSQRDTPDPCVKFFTGGLVRDSQRTTDPETACEDAPERGTSTGNEGERIDSLTSVESRAKVADSLTSVESRAKVADSVTDIEDQDEMDEPITNIDTENVGEVVVGAVKTGNRSRSKKDDAQSFPENHAESAKLQPTSTYERVRLQSKMWRKPEGGVNREVLHSYLDAILCFLLSHPGCSLLKLGQRFHPIFSPVALRELVEILEELGCLKLIVLKPRPPASLFSKRAPAVSLCVSDSSEDSTSDVLYEPTVDCVHRLGQFLDFLHK